jgi:hypothetical protein
MAGISGKPAIIEKKEIEDSKPGRNQPGHRFLKDRLSSVTPLESLQME